MVCFRIQQDPMICHDIPWIYRDKMRQVQNSPNQLKTSWIRPQLGPSWSLRRFAVDSSRPGAMCATCATSVGPVARPLMTELTELKLTEQGGHRERYADWRAQPHVSRMCHECGRSNHVTMLTWLFRNVNSGLMNPGFLNLLMRGVFTQ